MAAEPAVSRDSPARAVAKAFYQACVLAKNPEDARAIANSLGVPRPTDGTKVEAFDVRLGGTSGILYFASTSLCMLELPEVDVDGVLATLTILDPVMVGNEYRLVDNGDSDFSDFPDNQTRPTFDWNVPKDAIVLRREEVVTDDSRNVRLLALGKRPVGVKGSIYLIRETHPDPVIPRPLQPPRGWRGHGFETPPSDDIADSPSFPEDAFKACAHGTVGLRILIDESGGVLKVAIDRSSGRDDLDQAAADAALHWKFKPGTREGLPAWGELLKTVEFPNPCATAQ
jgi:TonB family protein